MYFEGENANGYGKTGAEWLTGVLKSATGEEVTRKRRKEKDEKWKP